MRLAIGIVLSTACAVHAWCQEPAAQGGQAAPSDEQADAACAALKKALANSAEDGKISALREAASVKHEKIVRAVGALLTKDTERVRIAAALALGDIDHPQSSKLLVGAIAPHEKTPAVLAAIAKSLGKLGWESAAAALHEVLKKVGDEQVRAAVPEVLSALGGIGSVSSIDPLIDFLHKLAGGRRAWPNEKELRNACNRALQAITGGDASKPLDWEQWWKANKELRMVSARTWYWNKLTQSRTDYDAKATAPPDCVPIGTRINDAPPVAEQPKRGESDKPPENPK